MKNILFLILAGSMLSLSTQAQSKKKSTPVKIKIPETVDVSFKSSYAVAENNKWSKNYSGNYVANFTNANSQSQSSEYNAAGVLVKTKTTIDSTLLPEAVTVAVEKRYPAAKITECVKVEIPALAPYYKVKLLKTDNKEKELLISEEGAVTQ